MAKKKSKPAPSRNTEHADKAPTLKDLLDPALVDKLKSQANQLKEQEAAAKEAERVRVQEQKAAEQKKLESSFEYLLNNSDPNWKKYK